MEIAKPLDESWDTAGPLLRLLASATPKLLNAAYDARVAMSIVGNASAKVALAPDAKANSRLGLSYQAVINKEERLRAWGKSKENNYAELAVPGSMASAISRAAGKAYQRHDQGRVSFESPRILIRAAETVISKDEKGIVLSVKLRSKGVVRFAIAHSRGAHHEIMEQIAAGKRSHGDCKIQVERKLSKSKKKKKWFALLSYEADEVVPLTIDPSKTLAMHRGVRNAISMLSTTGHWKTISGAKFMGRRRKLAARKREDKRISACELGTGAKGHGSERRLKSYKSLEDKIARDTKTWLQQIAAEAQKNAECWGMGLILIEDYGGIEEDDNAAVRRVLERFPLYQLKEAINHRATSRGHTVREVPSFYISSTCPGCGNQDTKQHNIRTNIFHCHMCSFERPADWVAAYWMLKHGGADCTIIDDQLQRQRKLAESLRKEAVA